MRRIAFLFVLFFSSSALATVNTIPVDSSGREVSPQSKLTYYAASTFTPAATPTDIVTICGSATKTVRMLSFKITTTNTAAGSQTFFLIKRSTADTTGTFVAATAVPADSTNGAATATAFGHYTANPGALGTSVGNVNVKRVASPVLVPGSFAGVKEDAGVEMLDNMANSHLDQPITLRGIAQCLCLNFNGAALVAGQIHTYQLVWIEE